MGKEAVAFYLRYYPGITAGKDWEIPQSGASQDNRSWDRLNSWSPKYEELVSGIRGPNAFCKYFPGFIVFKHMQLIFSS